MPRKIAEFKRAETAVVGPVVTLRGRVIRADGTDEGERVIAFHHPDNRITRLWRTARTALGMPAGRIDFPPKGA